MSTISEIFAKHGGYFTDECAEEIKALMRPKPHPTRDLPRIDETKIKKRVVGDWIETKHGGSDGRN